MIKKLKLDKNKSFDQHALFALAEKLNEVIDIVNKDAKEGEANAVPKKTTPANKAGNAKG